MIKTNVIVIMGHFKSSDFSRSVCHFFARVELGIEYTITIYLCRTDYRGGISLKSIRLCKILDMRDYRNAVCVSMLPFN